MAASARGIEIPLRVRPDSSVRRSLRGVTNEVRKATVSELANAKRAAEERRRIEAKADAAKGRASAKSLAMQMRMMAVEKAEAKRVGKAKEQAAKKAADVAIREEQRAAAAKIREYGRFNRFMDRQARQRERTDMRVNRSAVREAQKAHKEIARAQREQGSERRQLLAGVGGAIVGAGGYALSRTGAYGATLGAKSNEELLTQSLDFKRKSTRISNQAQMSTTERDEMESTVLDVSKKSGLDANTIMEGLGGAQANFSEFGGAKAFLPLLPELAAAAVANDADIGKLINTLGVFRRQLGETDESMKDRLFKMVDSANKGNVELEDIASKWAAGIGALGRDAIPKGRNAEETARNGDVVLGIAQALGASDLTPEEAATRATNMVTAFKKGDVLEGFRSQFGVNVQNEDGSIRDLEGIITDLANAGWADSNNGLKRQSVIKDAQGQDAISILVKQALANPQLFSELMRPDAEAGRRYAEKTSGELLSGTGGTALTLGARQFEAYQTSEQTEGFQKFVVNAADGLAQLTGKYPAYTEAIGGATFALSGFAAALFGTTLLQGRIAMLAASSGTANSAVSTLASTAGTAGSSLGKFGKALGSAGLLIGTLVAAYEGTKSLLEASGEDKKLEDFGGFLYDVAHGDPAGAVRRGGSPTDNLAKPWPKLPGRVISNPRKTPTSEELMQQVKVGDSTILLRVDGPAKVVGVTQGANAPTIALESGR